MLDVVVVGAGQSALAMAYHLSQGNCKYLLVDDQAEIGASWLTRWDSLKLFTPSEFNHLPGLPFPAPKGHYPNKTEVANYLKAYVAHFDIPVRLGQAVSRIQPLDEGFVVHLGTEQLLTRKVVVATGPFHAPFVPRCSQRLGPEVMQMHAKAYKNPGQLHKGTTLVVGAGDSGVQILEDIANSGRPVHFAGNTSLSVLPQQFLGKTLWWWLAKTGLLSVNKYSWLGKRLSTRMQPIIGTDVNALFNRDKVYTHGRVVDCHQDCVTFSDGQLPKVANVIWATGYRPDFSWLDGVSLDDGGYPHNTRGVSPQPGLFFIGLPWMYTRGSATLGGVADDAAYLAPRVLAISAAMTNPAAHCAA